MKITVMGPGGVGGYFGARLAAAGNDVTFVARGSHLAAMRKHGLRLDAELGPLLLNPVQVVADAREIAAADVIIFAVKMRDTESAALSLKPLVAKGAADGPRRFLWGGGGRRCGAAISDRLCADREVPGQCRQRRQRQRQTPEQW